MALRLRGIAERYEHTILMDLRQRAPWEDLRRLRTLAAAVTGLVLEQDARLGKIALAFHEPERMPARIRRLERLLDGSWDARRLYLAMLAPELARWNGLTARLVIDTSRIGGGPWFVRLALCYRRRAIPISWRSYEANSPMVGYDVYRTLLEETQAVLPECVQRCLIADRGFAHESLYRWCTDQDWRYRLVVKCNTLTAFPGFARKALQDRRWEYGETRFIHTAFVGLTGFGPVGLVMAWPTHYHSPSLFVISDDAPGLFTIPDVLRRPAIEEAFKDDKSGGFRLDSIRQTACHRLDRLLTLMALAYLYLVSVGDAVVADEKLDLVQPSAGHEMSRFQIGARTVRRAAWEGHTVKLRLRLTPDPAPESRTDAEREARHEYWRIGLTPGKVWFPPRSFESQNFYWWLPGKVKPRFATELWR